MEMVGREIWTGTSSEALSRQSSISERIDTTVSTDTRSLRSTSSRKNASALQMCIRESTPPSVSDDSFSVHMLNCGNLGEIKYSKNRN